MEVNKTLGTYWFRNINTYGVYENEFRISTIGNYRLIVSRVAFLNKRKGTMTELLNVLLAFCQENGIGEIVIQSVETYEMMQFCIKNNFAAAYSNIMVGEVLMGDYILKIV